MKMLIILMELRAEEALVPSPTQVTALWKTRFLQTFAWHPFRSASKQIGQDRNITQTAGLASPAWTVSRRRGVRKGRVQQLLVTLCRMTS